MHMAGSMVIYSSSPPAVWSTHGSLSSSSTSSIEIDSHGRPLLPHNSASRPVVGGLSSLFGSSNSKISYMSPCSVNDCSDSQYFSSSGMVRSFSQNDLSHTGGFWDGNDGRSGSVSIPSVSSGKMKDRSPVSVLHGPISRSSHHNSSIFSLVAWESSVGTGLPPLDPHLERYSRRRTALSVDERRPLSRSVGFEVGCDGNLLTYPSRVLSTDPHAALMAPLLPVEKGLGVNLEQEVQELIAARERLTRLSEEVLDQSSAPATRRKLSAEELLLDAQSRHTMFMDPFVIKAFTVAEKAHGGQVRRSGDLYLSHCVETAILLAGTGADSTVIAAGLLHDVLDDTDMNHEQLRESFGFEVDALVEGVSKLSAFSQLARDNETAGNPVEADMLRTMFLVMVDVRVVLIKLADRLHNLRTLGALSSSKQLGMADETLEIFAPLASRLGIWSWKAEMEDICFKYLKPLEHKELESKLAEGWREGIVMSSIQQLEAALCVEGVEFTDLCGRPKNLYSIYKKMSRKGRSIDEICDVRGLRLIVEDKESCYAALEVVHKLWAHRPKKFKDYIREPKGNGYQSLHTVVLAEDGHPLEVQIRTLDMHHQAEFGVAAHWRYKEDNSKHSPFLLQKVEWARWLLTWHSELLDTKLRASPLGADFRPPCPFPFHKDNCPHALVCSLPPHDDDEPLFVIMIENENMRVQELPSGSTAADLVSKSKTDMDSFFASRNEESCTYKVNHQFVENLNQKLRMGDLVEIASNAGSVVMVRPRANGSEPELIEASVPTAGKPCGKIALEFQREQLKRLYLDGASFNEEARRGPQTPQEKSSSLATLS